MTGDQIFYFGCPPTTNFRIEFCYPGHAQREPNPRVPNVNHIPPACVGSIMVHVGSAVILFFSTFGNMKNQRAFWWNIGSGKV